MYGQQKSVSSKNKCTQFAPLLRLAPHDIYNLGSFVDGLIRGQTAVHLQEFTGATRQFFYFDVLFLNVN